MIHLARRSRGEQADDIDPSEYGLRVIARGPLASGDADARLGRFYARAKERTGVTIPELEPYLEAAASTDPENSGDVDT